jgi:hypothetical protein
MAYTQEGGMSFSLIDSAGIQSSYHIPLLIDPTQTVTQAAAAWNTVAALLDAVTGAKIERGSVTVEIQGSGITFTPKSPSPTVPSNMSLVGNISFPQTTTGRLYTTTWGAISTPPLTTSGNHIDETDPTFTAFVAPFETPITFAAFVSNSFRTLTAHSRSFRSARKHRRAEIDLSLEKP